MPGLEADDVIGSLVEGLLHGDPQHQPTPLEPPASSSLNCSSPFPTTTSASSFFIPTPATAATHAKACTAPHHASHRVSHHRPVGRVVIASADADMLQLLSHSGCAWLELRHLSRSASAQEPPPLSVRSRPLPGIPSMLMQLHEAVIAAPMTLNAPHATAAAETHAKSGNRVPLRPLASVTTAPGASLLPAAAYPDYLALVGKAEAGVPGVGLSSRAARKLLLKYGSIEGIVRACEKGSYDEALRPLLVGMGRGSAGVWEGRVSEAAALGAEGGSSSSDSGCVLRSAGEGKLGAGRAPPLLQALRNVQVTRMRRDPAMVPWGKVRSYQRQRREQRQQQQQAEQQQQLMAAAVEVHGLTGLEADMGTRAKRGCSPARQELACVSPASLEPPWLPSLAPLHPHDLLHARSAGPFCTDLASALRRRGLAYRTCIRVDEQQGLMADLVMPAGRCAQQPQQQPPQQGQQQPPGAYQHAAAAAVEALAERLMSLAECPLPPSAGAGLSVRMLLAATVHASERSSAADRRVGVYDGGDGGQRGHVSEALPPAAGSGVPAPNAAVASAACERSLSDSLCVYVLSPWDFDYKRYQHLQRTKHASLRGQQWRQHPCPDVACTPNASLLGGDDTPGCIASRRPAAAAPAPQPQDGSAAGAERRRLLAFAGWLQSAAGPRESLLHTPPTLQALLRSTTAWRLNRMQRRLGSVAVVPFYELMLMSDS
ncbi:hypothetical protein Agub_g6558 [Astrephomene gubernaculifera]|uniref:Uncharacterized protein n=1 Tax=Astrephomene gubernaculifera TaxID=47775 RepID=A0AAD3HLJ1_9CHLO|nr:hypothetical protein Agub_g6558 [Astrephomene gubernaculifera]